MVHFSCLHKELLFYPAFFGRKDFFLLGLQDPQPVIEIRKSYDIKYDFKLKMEKAHATAPRGFLRTTVL